MIMKGRRERVEEEGEMNEVEGENGEGRMRKMEGGKKGEGEKRRGEKRKRERGEERERRRNPIASITCKLWNETVITEIQVNLPV